MNKQFIRFYLTDTNYHFSGLRKAHLAQFSFGFTEEQNSQACRHEDIHEHVIIHKQIKKYAEDNTIVLAYQVFDGVGKPAGPLYVACPGTIVSAEELAPFKEIYENGLSFSTEDFEENETFTKTWGPVAEFFKQKEKLDGRGIQYSILQIGVSMFLFLGRDVGVLPGMSPVLTRMFGDRLLCPVPDSHQKTIIEGLTKIKAKAK